MRSSVLELIQLGGLPGDKGATTSQLQALKLTLRFTERTPGFE